MSEPGLRVKTIRTHTQINREKLKTEAGAASRAGWSWFNPNPQMLHKQQEGGGGFAEEGGKKRGKGRNQYFLNMATLAAASDSEHHEKI